MSNKVDLHNSLVFRWSGCNPSKWKRNLEPLATGGSVSSRELANSRRTAGTTSTRVIRSIGQQRSLVQYEKGNILMGGFCVIEVTTQTLHAKDGILSRSRR